MDLNLVETRVWRLCFRGPTLQPLQAPEIPGNFSRKKIRKRILRKNSLFWTLPGMASHFNRRESSLGVSAWKVGPGGGLGWKARWVQLANSFRDHEKMGPFLVRSYNANLWPFPWEPCNWISCFNHSIFKREFRWISTISAMVVSKWFTRWFQRFFSPLEKWSNLTSIFFRWVGEKPPTSLYWGWVAYCRLGMIALWGVILDDTHQNLIQHSWLQNL